MNLTKYWARVPSSLRGKLTLFNRPASADALSPDNPVLKLVSECRIEDFCALKIDVDTPRVEVEKLGESGLTDEEVWQRTLEKVHEKIREQLDAYGARG